jgi:hypothetical protein
MGAADAPAGAREAALSRVDDCDDDASAADCSAASLALVLHRSGGVAAVADALASPPAVGGGGGNGLGVEADAAASLRVLLNAAVPGLECAHALRCRISHGCSNTLLPRAGGARLALC